MISFSCVGPVIGHEFRYNIAKVAVHKLGCQLNGFADYFDNVITKFIVNNRTDT